MSPEEIPELIQALMFTNDYRLWLAYLLALIFSTSGAYLGSYLSRKAEDRASQENFDSLRDQLRKTTHDTEEIRNELSRRTWLTQQQWGIREQHYVGLLATLTRLKLSLEDRQAFYLMPGSAQDDSIPKDPGFASLARSGYESYQVLREQIGPASLYLSAHAIGALERLVRDYWNASEFSASTEQYVSDALDSVEIARAVVLSEAKAELINGGAL